MSRIDHLEAYHLAIELVKKAGFRLHHVSGQTETTYYEHPARPGLLLRLSMHKTKKSPMGLGGVVSRMTFSPKDTTLSALQVRNGVIWAIGSYFLRDPAPSRYQGKRGTWEGIAQKCSARQEGMFKA